MKSKRFQIRMKQFLGITTLFDHIRFRTWSYRFAEEVLNSKLSLKKEIEDIIESIDLSPNEVSRPRLNSEGNS